MNIDAVYCECLPYPMKQIESIFENGVWKITFVCPKCQKSIRVEGK